MLFKIFFHLPDIELNCITIYLCSYTTFYLWQYYKHYCKFFKSRISYRRSYYKNRWRDSSTLQINIGIWLSDIHHFENLEMVISNYRTNASIGSSFLLLYPAKKRLVHYYWIYNHRNFIENIFTKSKFMAGWDRCL